jgi:uncharacterized protein YfaS (alpha-2-macroglobulin family)
MSKRVNPMPNKRVKLVSYWSGIMQANGNGEANIEFDVPAFSGQLRLMAVAYKDDRFGSADAVMTVADPLVLSTALPRFLSPGDTVSVPVTISNTTGKNIQAVANAKALGQLRVYGNVSQTLSVAPNSEGRAEFRIFAASAAGTGKLVVDVQGGGEKYTDETDMAIRPASPLLKNSGSGAVNGNSIARFAIGAADFLPGSTSYVLMAGRSPVMQVADQLSKLVQYPYGCTEQVVSAAFPQLYYSDLAELLQKNKASKPNANANIQEAIRKIKMRQLYNGGLMLWDNESTESWWTTIFAAHFLLEAGKAGYDIDKSLTETMLAYINNKLKNKETILYIYNRDQQKKIAPKEVAYSLYVLAMAGAPNISAMNYYKAHPEILSLDSRYLLSAAYAVAGDKSRFIELLPSSFSGEESLAQTGGSFYSDVRDEAIALNVLVDVDPANRQVPVMARHVADKLKRRTWLSTQESVFSFLALGKLARASAKSTVTANIKINGKQAATAGAEPVRLASAEAGITNIEIITKGEGQMYYWWQSEGLSATGNFTEEDNYLKVRRNFFDRYGRMVSGNEFEQNALVIIQVTLEKSYSGSVENIVITDMIPAGFEIENPRTKEIPGMDWIKDASNPVQLDVRDDRINLFVDLHSSRQTYYYAVRAVSPGVYKMGPVSADAMYNGEYHSYHGSGTIKVR